jgi:molybdopterin-guanine dinucleotide biosynthesis protein A
MLLLNTNDAALDKELPGIERLADSAPGEGPIAGILAALSQAEQRGFMQVASFACDTPFFPRDTAVRLAEALQSPKADYAVARCAGTIHRIFALWPATCRVRLEQGFESGARSMRDIETWLAPAWTDFPPGAGPGGDPFFNINTPADLETAELWIGG